MNNTGMLVGSGDSARSLTDYYPAWLDNLADDVSVEGSAMDGVVEGAEAIRNILVTIRSLYDHQAFNFVRDVEPAYASSRRPGGQRAGGGSARGGA
jgi:hypothetical protein